MQIIMAFVLTLSMIFSTVFGNTDLQNILVGLHLLTHTIEGHDHDHHHGEHSHDHQKSHTDSVVQKALKVTHTHGDSDSHDEGEPHEHSFSMNGSAPSFIPCSHKFGFLSVVTSVEFLPVSENRIKEPSLNGLFRPPIS